MDTHAQPAADVISRRIKLRQIVLNVKGAAEGAFPLVWSVTHMRHLESTRHQKDPHCSMLSSRMHAWVSVNLPCCCPVGVTVRVCRDKLARLLLYGSKVLNGFKSTISCISTLCVQVRTVSNRAVQQQSVSFQGISGASASSKQAPFASCTSTGLCHTASGPPYSVQSG